jgi:hypothetical protein
MRKPAFNYDGVAIACLGGAKFLAIGTEKVEVNVEEQQPIPHSNDSSVVDTSVSSCTQ